MENNATVETRTNIRKLLGAFLFSGEDVDKKVLVLSGGEKARLAIAVMLLRPFNFLVLDEPTNHLDILSKNVLKEALQNFNGSMIVVSHDREFLSELTDKTVEFRERKLKTYLGDINYFLEKRKIDDIRKIEFKTESESSSESVKAQNSTPTKVSYEERKALQKELKKVERKIEKLEREVHTLEEEMLDPNFHNTPEANEKLKQHGVMKNDLDITMETWEKVQAKVDAISN